MNIFLQVIAGLIIADFFSGFIHWVQDRYARPSWPIVGAAVADAHAHHAAPGKMLLSGFWSRNLSTIVLVAVIGLIVVSLGWLNVATFTALIVGSMANEIHATTHRRAAPWPVKAARYIGLVQTPAHHNKHHTAKDGRAYCVVTSWLNSSLDHLGLWQNLEIVLIVFGIWPNEVKGASK